MKKNLLYLFTVLCVLSFFPSCNDDEKPEVPPTVEDVLATYTAEKLKAEINGVVASENAKIEIVQQEDKTITIKLFNIVPDAEQVDVPNAKFEAVTKSAYKSVLSGETSDYISGYKVTLNGTVDEGILNIKVALVEIQAENTKTANLINLVYKGAMNIAVQGLGDPVKQEQRVYLEKPRTNPADSSMVKLTIRNFAFDALSLGNISVDTILVQKRGDVYVFNAEKRKIKVNVIGEVDANLKGTIVGNELNLSLSIDAAGLKVNVDFKGADVIESPIVKMKSVKFAANPVIVDQPTFIPNPEPFTSDSIFSFNVWESTPDNQLMLAFPACELSEGASIDSVRMNINGKFTAKLDLSKPIDFSKLKTPKDHLMFHLKAQDPRKTAKVKMVMSRLKSLENTKFTFGEWVAGEADYSDPKGWGTSNPAAVMLRGMEGEDGAFYDNSLPYPVSQDGDAAKIITVDTKGWNLTGFAVIPAVTAGTLFQGEFSINLSNTLKSTKFGLPYLKEPTSFKGTYKYKSGAKYYQTVLDPSIQPSGVLKKEIPGMVDSCAINAVLYEVSNYTETLDGTNANTSTKIVAIASLPDPSDRASFTDFNIEFKYIKKYDATKKYKLAIVCSSSFKGDKFEGAPGSELIIKALEVIAK